jgi:hypothetical protein
MESIEEIVRRLFPGANDGMMVVLDSLASRLLSDPAFRRLMAEELVKVDMEAVRSVETYASFGKVESKSPAQDYFTQDQLTVSVLKERERLAEEFAAQPHMEFFGREIADFIRTERTE